VAETLASFGRLDILFNNAGMAVAGTAETTSEADWEALFRLNVTGVWRMSKLAIPIMRAQGGGAIVNNASDWGMVAGRNTAAYCASKGAVIQLTKAMALDHAREGLRVNAVCPGDTFVERWTTEGYHRNAANATTDEMLRSMGEALPMGRVGQAEEIAKAVLFLASDDSSFMTGTTLVVDGGNTAA
jgi:meso-butanediol dehydrogenase / (S,S)-butanediol dehydrogenase / diacetyl reductase